MALRQGSAALLRLAAARGSACMGEGLGRAGGVQAQQLRFLGGDKIPEFFGKPSPYTEGTAFLGTPPNKEELYKKRPLAPDVFEIDMKSAHYKFPLAAISSVTNRVTGTMLTAGFTAAGYVALTGDLPGALAAFKANYPVLAFGTKLVVVWPLVFHWLGGVRHIVWDTYKIGNQTDHSDLLEVPKVELSSKILFGSSAALTLLIAML